MNTAGCLFFALEYAGLNLHSEATNAVDDLLWKMPRLRAAIAFDIIAICLVGKVVLSSFYIEHFVDCEDQLDKIINSLCSSSRQLDWLRSPKPNVGTWVKLLNWKFTNGILIDSHWTRVSFLSRFGLELIIRTTRWRVKIGWKMAN